MFVSTVNFNALLVSHLSKASLLIKQGSWWFWFLFLSINFNL